MYKKSINKKKLGKLGLSTRKVPVEEFILDTLINRGIYLGYHRSMRNTKMSFDLTGSRRGMDIHNLNHTQYAIRGFLRLLSASWIKHSNVWLVTLSGDYKFDLLNFETREYVTFWAQKWIPGVFSNKYAFLTLKYLPRFPSLLFFNSYTGNYERFKEILSRGIFQLALADTNSDRKLVRIIGANEKTVQSWDYFILLALNTLEHFLEEEKINFVSKWWAEN